MMPSTKKRTDQRLLEESEGGEKRRQSGSTPGSPSIPFSCLLLLLAVVLFCCEIKRVLSSRLLVMHVPSWWV